MVCSQLENEEFDQCVLQDLELRGYGAYIPLTAKVIMDSVPCANSSQKSEVGQEVVKNLLGPFDEDVFDNFTLNHLPSLTDCNLEFDGLWECMYAPWGQCGLQVLLTVCLSLLIVSALLLLLTRNKVVLPWLNKTVRQIATYLRSSRLVNLPQRSTASSSSNGTRPRRFPKQINPKTIFPKMRSAMRQRLKSSSTKRLSQEVLNFNTIY